MPDHVRKLIREDIPSVGGLFQRILRKTARPSTADLEDYLARLFLEGPEQDPDIHSHVHVRADGTISGFVGVMPMPMLAGDTPLRAAICGTLMVEDHGDDPFAGARLMRAFLAGPQDISLTETANDISTTMWRKLRGTVLPGYSLEWLRILRPAGFFAEMGAGLIPAARLLKPLARPVDALVRRGEPKWSSLPAEIPAGTLASKEANDQATADLFRSLTAQFRLRPAWGEESLRRMIAESRRKANYGEMVRRVVTRRDGHPLGLFLYYGDAGRIGRVVQILAAAGHAGEVIDSMLAHANERGMVAMRGRCQPDLLEAMLGRRFAFVHASSSIVHARDPVLLEPFLAGRAFFNGFAGESWSRLMGDSFD